jgi:hypothetical protein
MTAAVAQTRLIVLRGNSGSGKSSVAKALRDAYGRGVAVVSQDTIRRTILRDRDRPLAANIGLIDQVTRYCLENGCHVVVEGILDASRYGSMLAGLGGDYTGRSPLLPGRAGHARKRGVARTLLAEILRRWPDQGCIDQPDRWPGTTRPDS